MKRKKLCAVLGTALCLCVPAVVLALQRGDGDGRGLSCPDPENPVCALYAVCRPILDQYPGSEIDEKGKDCTLTVESRQLIIRRKLADGEPGYFFYARRLDGGRDAASR